jgi:drug/metabolite transporter (DMT)-like permease
MNQSTLQMNKINNRQSFTSMYLGFLFLELCTHPVSSLSVTRTIPGHVRLPFRTNISRTCDFKPPFEYLTLDSIRSRLQSSFLDLESDTKSDNDQEQRNDHEQFIEILEMEDERVFKENGYDLDQNAFNEQQQQQEEVESPILSKLWQSRLMVLFAAALYGTNFTAIKVLDENIPTSVGPVFRFSLAALVTFPFLFIGKEASNEDSNAALSYPKDLSPFDKSYGAIVGGMEIGMWNTIGYLSQAKALETIPASVCAFICSLAVVTVPFLDFLSGKKLSSQKIIGAAIAVLGVAFLELDGLSDSLDAKSSLFSIGTLFSLVQPVAFGLGFWRMEHYARKHPSEGMKVTVSQVTSIAVLSICTLLATSGMEGIPDISQVTSWLTNPTILLAILWTGCVTTALTIFIETQALKVLSAAETTMLYSFEPLFGAAFASFVLGETFGVGGYTGAALVLAGCLFSNMSKPTKEADPI